MALEEIAGAGKSPEEMTLDEVIGEYERGITSLEKIVHELLHPYSTMETEKEVAKEKVTKSLLENSIRRIHDCNYRLEKTKTLLEVHVLKKITTSRNPAVK
jgi:predicted HTH domain antitoxin